MQAVILLAIFSMLLSIMGNIVSSNLRNTTSVKFDTVAETKEYFNKLAKVINEQITPRYMDANPDNVTTGLAAYIESRTELRALAIGNDGGKFRDAWNQPVVGRMIEENRYLLGNSTTGTNSYIIAPVHGFLFVSGGPDIKVTTDYSAVNTIADMYGLTPAGDDIVFAFDTSAAQKKVMTTLQTRIGRVVAASISNLEARLGVRQQLLLKEYQNRVLAELSPNTSLIELENDTAAKDAIANRALFLQLTPTNCRTIGVSQECEAITAALPSSSARLALTSTSTTLSFQPMAVMVGNDTVDTPWSISLSTIADISVSAVTK